MQKSTNSLFVSDATRSTSLQTILVADKPATIYVGFNLRSQLKENPEKLDALQISSIIVIGNTTPDGKLFHYHLLMVGQDPAESLALNMLPTYEQDGMRGILQLEYGGDLSRILPEAITFKVELLPERNNNTLENLFHCLLTKYRLDRYKFNDDGQGCRHWCATALEKLAGDNFVGTEVGKRFQEFEEEEVRKWGSKFPMPRIKGTFYDEGSE